MYYSSIHPLINPFFPPPIYPFLHPSIIIFSIFFSLGFNLGVKQSGEVVDHVKLPPWAHNDPRLFVLKHRQVGIYSELDFIIMSLYIKWGYFADLA